MVPDKTESIFVGLGLSTTMGFVQTPNLDVSEIKTILTYPVNVCNAGARNPPMNLPLLNVELALLSGTFVAPVKSVQGPDGEVPN